MFSDHALSQSARCTGSSWLAQASVLLIRATRQRVAHIANDAMYAPPPDEVIYGAEQGARRRAKELTEALSDEQRQAGWRYKMEMEEVSVPLPRRPAGTRGRGERHASHGR